MIIEYKYKGAKALVGLHEKHLKSFHKIWIEAKQKNIKLPSTNDPDYESLEKLLQHVLRSAGGYMIWICEKLNLPNPGIKKVPDVSIIEIESIDYLNHILERWNGHLNDIDEKRFYSPVYISNWGPEYCIDAMLEHAVMHPIRHKFQLETLIKR